MNSTAARQPSLRLLLGGLIGLASQMADAGNGFNDFAFGSRAYGLAGADLATSNDATAVNANPAGLSHIEHAMAGLYIEPYVNAEIRHTDDLGNDKGADAPYGVSMGAAYGRRIKDSAFVFGVGLFAQGGAGFVYSDLNTPFGTQDELRSSFATLKLAPGLAWQASDALSIGLAVGINYSAARQKVFPNVSFVDPQGIAPSFSGFRVDSQSGVSFNGKAGFQYRPHKQWVIAGAYTSKTKVKLEDGTLKINYDAQNLGRVTYGKSSQEGLTLAREAGLGFSYSAVDELWLVTAEVNWVDWSSALKTSTLSASKPDNALAPETLEFVSKLNWRDQYVIAIGAERRLSERTTIRGGFNYGRNPVPDNTLTPLLPLLGEKAFTAGITRKLSGPWEFSAAALYQLPVKVRYTNPDSLFGPNNTESFDAAALQFMVSRRW